MKPLPPSPGASPRPDEHAARPAAGSPGRLLVTAGPTHEPIDAVRFIGNRSSGRLGVSLAEEAAREGWTVTLLLGPTPVQPSDSRVTLHRFRTTADLQALLAEHLAACDVLVMAAAVADYRPKATPQMLAGKNRRVEGGGMSIELESTPDLLAGCAAARRPGQLIVGFALEPQAELEASARRKLAKKKVDLIVANPLATMDAASIEATVFGSTPTGLEPGRSTGGPIAKERFAGWLLDIISEVRARLAGGLAAPTPSDTLSSGCSAPSTAAPLPAALVSSPGHGSRVNAGSPHARSR
jgi:phosphopantothenoylcysteine decarboxylase/phosphopantothenate--cysteine ligase